MKVFQRACQAHLKQEQARLEQGQADTSPPSIITAELDALIHQLEKPPGTLSDQQLKVACQQREAIQVTKKVQKQPAKHLFL
ncbi:hypothetical protein [Marinospirillum sp.]|uniref:hypothetical protein n=1 Tax=Marinospirillum sp. TaxID=2183934 RepID=UPI003A87C2C3